MSEEQKKKVEDKVIVVQELPQQGIRKADLETGETVNLITISEALTQIYQDIQEIKKGVA